MSAIIHQLFRPGQRSPIGIGRASVSNIHERSSYHSTAAGVDAGRARLETNLASEPDRQQGNEREAVVEGHRRSWSPDVIEGSVALGVAVAAPLLAMIAVASAGGFGIAPAQTVVEVSSGLPLASLLIGAAGGRQLADRGASFSSSVARSTKAGTFAAVVLVAASFAFADALDPSSLLMLAAALIASAALAGALSRAVLSSPLVAARLRRNVAIYGSGPQARALQEQIARDTGRVFAGIFDARQSPDRMHGNGSKLDGDLSDLVALVARGLVDEVILALPSTAPERMQEICNRFRSLPVEVGVTADTCLNGSEVGRGEALNIGGHSLMRIHRRPIAGWGAVTKTALDRTTAAAALLLLSPLLAVIAVAIKIESKGPVFFRQRRHGWCGQMIVVWKFRTMRVMEDGAVVRQASKTDDRVTRIGRLLRRTSLDELPQLINVLEGSMSLVGPRPHAIAHDEHYGALLSTYSRRSIVRPGITGWAQINGLRGETRTTDEMSARVQHDLWYVANWSIWLDMRILLLTPLYGLVHRNAY